MEPGYARTAGTNCERLRILQPKTGWWLFIKPRLSAIMLIDLPQFRVRLHFPGQNSSSAWQEAANGQYEAQSRWGRQKEPKRSGHTWCVAEDAAGQRGFQHTQAIHTDGHGGKNCYWLLVQGKDRFLNASKVISGSWFRKVNDWAKSSSTYGRIRSKV